MAIRTFILLLISLAYSPVKAQTHDEDLQKYVGKIFNLLLENRLQAVDTLFNPISHQALIERYNQVDTCVNDMWTRPQFIDNVYHHSFDGVAVLMRLPYMDTICYRGSPEYIAFQRYIYHQDGVFSGIETAFLINRDDKALTSSQARENALNKIKEALPSSELVALLATNKNEYWVNAEIEIDSSQYILDRCQRKYRLALKPDFEFDQSYDGDIRCVTSEMESQVQVGVEGDVDTFLTYMDKLQSCTITNKTGFWTIDSNQLILLTKYGQEVLRFEIIQATGDMLELKKDRYRVKLKRTTI